MITMWDGKILKLEHRLEEVEEYRRLVLEAMKQITIGVVVVDKDSGKEMKVSKLKNGSNDFEALPIDGQGNGRGYNYMVRNWILKE